MSGRKGKGSRQRQLERRIASGRCPPMASPHRRRRPGKAPLCAECVAHPSTDPATGQYREPRPADPRFAGTLGGKPHPMCEVCWSAVYKSDGRTPRHVALRAEWQPESKR